MICFGNVPAGAVLPVIFDSYAGSTGASVTISGLAVTDIEIYKGTSITQRSSDAGYALIDTDGIDIDGITGIHGFSIDTGDNTDSGFFAVGSFFTVVVSAITVDSQTVNFVAATFRLVAAEGTAGTPSVDAVRISNSSTAADNLETAAVNYSATRGLAGTALPAAAADAAGGLIISDAGGLDADAQLVTKINAILDDTGTAGVALPDGVITAAKIAADAITAAKLHSDVTTELQNGLATSAALATVDTVVDGIKAVTDLLPDAGALTSIATASALGTVDTVVDAIKVKTDQLVFGVANTLNVNITYVNETEVTGDGQSGTEWGPA